MILLHTWVNPELEDKDLHFSFLFNRNFFVYDSTSEIQVKFEGIKNPTKQTKKKHHKTTSLAPQIHLTVPSGFAST